MDKLPRTRRDPRREQTRRALIAAAEALFGDHGIEHVTVRQIAAAIGSANNNVVSYHFGGKDALIEAIFDWRLPELDRQRAAFLERALAAGRADELSTLLEATWRPSFELIDDAGRRGFALFLRAVLHDRYGHLRRAMRGRTPHTEAISARILDLVAQRVDESTARRRLDVVSAMMLDAISLTGGADEAAAEALFRDALAMSAAALTAPAADSGV